MRLLRKRLFNVLGFFPIIVAFDFKSATAYRLWEALSQPVYPERYDEPFHSFICGSAFGPSLTARRVDQKNDSKVSVSWTLCAM